MGRELSSSGAKDIDQVTKGIGTQFEIPGRSERLAKGKRRSPRETKTRKRKSK